MTATADGLVVLGPDDHYRRRRTAPGIEMQLAQRRRFPDGEQLVLIPDPERLAHRDVLVVQTTSAPQDSRLMSLLQLAAAARDSGASSVTCFVPYLCYQRQDRPNRPGEPTTGRLVIEALAVSGAGRLLTVDRHNPGLGGAPSLELTEISAAPAFAALAAERGLHPDIVVSPDRGGAERATEIADLLGIPVAVLSKDKDPDGGRTFYRRLPASLARQYCLIVDDLCSSGSTLLPLCESLAAVGARCTIFVTHLLAPLSQLLARLPSVTAVVHTDSCGDPDAPISLLPLALEAWPGARAGAQPLELNMRG